jgi:hypothetical protein
MISGDGLGPGWSPGIAATLVLERQHQIHIDVDHLGKTSIGVTSVLPSPVGLQHRCDIGVGAAAPDSHRC